MRIISYDKIPHGTTCLSQTPGLKKIHSLDESHGLDESHSLNPIRVKDNQFVQLQELIDSKRKFLYDKQKSLRMVKEQNIFLSGVKNDYAKYNQYINDQKIEQIKAFQLLNNYITDLTNSGELTHHNLEDAEIEQQKILKEVDSIKKNLDTLIYETNGLTKK
jgi:hypothetical protein